MEPTIHCARPGQGCKGTQDDRVTAKSVAPESLRRRDIIIFETPKVAGELCGAQGKFVKRVIGLPGEVVREDNGQVSVGGHLLREPYVAPGHRDQDEGIWRVPKQHVFVMGDNRALSCDSRRFGSVPFENVVGRVTAISGNGRKVKLR